MDTIVKLREVLKSSTCLEDAVQRVYVDLKFHNQFDLHQIINNLIEGHIFHSYSNEAAREIVEFALTRLFLRMILNDTHSTIGLIFEKIGQTIKSGKSSQAVTAMHLLHRLFIENIHDNDAFDYETFESLVDNEMSAQICSRILQTSKDQLNQKIVELLITRICNHIAISMKPLALNKLLEVVPQSNSVVQSVIRRLNALNSNSEIRAVIYEHIANRLKIDDITKDQIVGVSIQDSVNIDSEWLNIILNSWLIDKSFGDKCFEFLGHFDLPDSSVSAWLSQCIAKWLNASDSVDVIRFLTEHRTNVSEEGLFLINIGLEMFSDSLYLLSDVFNYNWFDYLISMINIPEIMDDMQLRRRDFLVEHIFRIAKHIINSEHDRSLNCLIISTISKAFDTNPYVRYIHAGATYNVLSCDNNMKDRYLLSIVKSITNNGATEKEFAIVCLCVINRHWTFGNEIIYRMIFRSSSKEGSIAPLSIILYSSCCLVGTKLGKLKGLYEKAIMSFDLHTKLCAFDCYCTDLLIKNKNIEGYPYREFNTIKEDHELAKLVKMMDTMEIACDLSDGNKQRCISLMRLMESEIMFFSEAIALVIILAVKSSCLDTEFDIHYKTKSFLNTIYSMNDRRATVSMIDSISIIVERYVRMGALDAMSADDFSHCVELWWCLANNFDENEDCSRRCAQNTIKIVAFCVSYSANGDRLTRILGMMPLLLDLAKKALSSIVKEELIHQLGRLRSNVTDRNHIKLIVQLTNRIDDTAISVFRSPANKYIDQSEVTLSTSSRSSICVQDTASSSKRWSNESPEKFHYGENIAPTRLGSKLGHVESKCSEKAISVVSNSIQSLVLQDEFSE